MSHVAQLPVHRGFDTSLAMLSGSADHWSNVREGFVDMWLDDAPAHGLNGTYSLFQYVAHATDAITLHNASTPLFLYMALQVMHAPQEVPSRFSDLYSSTGRYSDDYAIMNGMATAADLTPTALLNAPEPA